MEDDTNPSPPSGNAPLPNPAQLRLVGWAMAGGVLMLVIVFWFIIRFAGTDFGLFGSAPSVGRILVAVALAVGLVGPVLVGRMAESLESSPGSAPVPDRLFFMKLVAREAGGLMGILAGVLLGSATVMFGFGLGAALVMALQLSSSKSRDPKRLHGADRRRSHLP